MRKWLCVVAYFVDVSAEDYQEAEGKAEVKLRLAGARSSSTICFEVSGRG